MENLELKHEVNHSLRVFCTLKSTAAFTKLHTVTFKEMKDSGQNFEIAFFMI